MLWQIAGTDLAHRVLTLSPKVTHFAETLSSLLIVFKPPLPLSNMLFNWHIFMFSRDEIAQVNGSCTIKSPQSWCTMEPEDMDMIMSFDTNCSIIVTQMAKQGNMETPTKSHTEKIVLYKSGMSRYLLDLNVIST